MRSVARLAATVGEVRRLRDTRVLDGLLAVALTIALQVHLQNHQHVDATLVNVVGALGLTLPLAVRHRAPFAMAATALRRDRRAERDRRRRAVRRRAATVLRR